MSADFQKTVICHLSSGQSRCSRSRSARMTSNTRGQEITDSRPRSYVSSKFSESVLKTCPNRCPKFGRGRKMLYLCIVKRIPTQKLNSLTKQTTNIINKQLNNTNDYGKDSL